ncbi:MAG: prolipoprotein diacylglyceryl transferase [Acidobacteriota bacterium]|nr:prolipoprotein diacylglyceryl transferase [Acidobacteriota bacterium]
MSEDSNKTVKRMLDDQTMAAALGGRRTARESFEADENSTSHSATVNLFQAWGYFGLALAITLAMALVWYRQMSYWTMITVILTAILSFLILAVLTEVRTGKPRLIYYRYLLAAVGSVAALLFSLDSPLLPYLDVTMLGIGLFVVCGRIGCLMVGCCHGRPHGWGVTYSKESAAADFPEHLVRVRLFPVQAVESFWVLAIVLTGVVQVIGGQPSGSALSSYVVAYGLGRFCFEFLRGDEGRRYFRGISEAQWTSLSMTSAVVIAEWYGALPPSSWHLLAVACLIFAILLINVTHAGSDSSDSSIAKIELCGRLEIGTR